MNTLLPIPTPPVTLSDPVEKLLDSVLSVIDTRPLNVEVPFTVKVSLISTSASISTSARKVEIPGTSSVPARTFPVTDTIPITSKSTFGNVLPIPTLLTPPTSLKTKLGAPSICPKLSWYWTLPRIPPAFGEIFPWSIHINPPPSEVFLLAKISPGSPEKLLAS